MRKPIPATKLLTLLLLPVLVFTGCFKDNLRHTYKIYTPVYSKLSEVRAALHSTGARALGNTGKIYMAGNRIYLNEKDKGIHIIDNTDPAHPKNIAFINIPGNRDIAVKGNTLYADLYCDMAAIDISNPLNITVKKYLTNVFPYRLDYYTNTTNPDSIKVITDWITRDSTVDEAMSPPAGCINCNVFYPGASQSFSTSATGTAGSMARFAVVNNYLYTVGNSNMNVIDVADPFNPTPVKNLGIGAGIETIYPFKTNLFVGSTTGMVVYNIQDPSSPQRVSFAAHWNFCDPVIADDQYAYVTLYGGSMCGGVTNEMDVYDIKDIYHPVMIKTYQLTNPHGLSKDGDLLFICDGRGGLKIFNAANTKDIKMVAHIAGIETYDIITGNNIACVVAKEGIYQYEYNNTGSTHLLSKIGW